MRAALSHQRSRLVFQSPDRCETAHPQYAFLIDLRDLHRIIRHRMAIERVEIGRRYRGTIEHFEQMLHSRRMRHELLTIAAERDDGELEIDPAGILRSQLMNLW